MKELACLIRKRRLGSAPAAGAVFRALAENIGLPVFQPPGAPKSWIRGRIQRRPGRACSPFQLQVAFLVLMFGCFALAGEMPTTPATAPVTARDFYNAGTQLLANKKFTEAQQMFQSALAAQDGRVQPAALYNLGHARFDEGAAALKKKMSADSAAARNQSLEVTANQAIQQAESALANNDLSQMVGAYLAGHGVRRELTSAQEAVQQAMDTYGNTLHQWQLAADDFHSAAELNPADTNAARNAELVERHIAQLVDSLRRMQSMAAMLGQQRMKLKGLLEQLGGRIPKQNLPSGMADDGDDGQGMQPESLSGMKEGPTQPEGKIEMSLSPDEATEILNGITPDSTRRLPMTEAQTGRERDRSLTW